MPPPPSILADRGPRARRPNQFHATHHPHPEHVDDLLGAMGRIAEAAPGVAGLDQIGAFLDADIAGPPGPCGPRRRLPSASIKGGRWLRKIH